MEDEKTFEELTAEIISMLEEKKYVKARDLLLENNAADIAEILESVMEELGTERTVLIFRTLPKDVSVDVFSYLGTEEQIRIINCVTEKEVKYIMDELAFDDMIDLLEELPANVVDKILENTPKAERGLINTFLNYPDTCAGSIMTPEYISLNKGMTVAQAMNYIKKVGMDSETIYTCYVKDAGRKLIGIVSLRTLVVSDDNALISDLMREDFVSVNVYDDQELVSEAFKKYDLIAMPVVDNEDRLVGIITVDDILDVIEEETTEDFERMAGVIDTTDIEYLDMSTLRHVKNRLPWLVGMMIALMITGAIITQFEDVLSKVIVLVAYMPLLNGTGGNSGSQAATLVIRGLTVGELEPHDAFKVLLKELRISFLIGLCLSALNFVKIVTLDGQPPIIALTVCLAILLIVMFAKAVGGMLPMIAKGIGLDPALMATPVISSITDMVAVVIYFLLAKSLLGI